MCRCSPSFFEEERRALHDRREKIRLLQQRKLTEFGSLKDLPEEIPLHLVIGTKVTGEDLSLLVARSQESVQASKATSLCHSAIRKFSQNQFSMAHKYPKVQLSGWGVTAKTYQSTGVFSHPSTKNNQKKRVFRIGLRSLFPCLESRSLLSDW